MSPKVLILSSLYDFSIDFVARLLNAEGVPYIRLNREQFSELRVTLDPVASVLQVRGLGIDATIRQGGLAIWYRCATFPRTALAVAATPDEQLTRSQWSAFLRSLTVFDTARWMNNPVDTYRAESKPLQLAQAAKQGFAVPRSLISNDVKSVCANFPDVLALKSMDTAYLKDGSDMLFAYTQIVQSDSLTDGNLAFVPVLAQKVLSPKRDIRVTIIGDKTFAYEILIDQRPAEGDWRLNKRDAISYHQFSLDDRIASLCVGLCKSLHLPFGAIDLAISDETVWFIELNPTGEWAWLPDAQQTAAREIALWLSGEPCCE